MSVGGAHFSPLAAPLQNRCGWEGAPAVAQRSRAVPFSVRAQVAAMRYGWREGNH